MIHYEVTLECSDSTAPALERFMRNTHIPEVLATGCFSAIHFDQAEGRFRTVYQASSQQQFDRYLTDPAETMRARFRDEFAVGVAVSREVWNQVQSWAPM